MNCSKCGAKTSKAAVFCSSCGKKLPAAAKSPKTQKTVNLMAHEIRVPYASGPFEMIELGDGPFELAANSIEAKNANAAFDPSIPPMDGDLVPLDCVWSWARHPGDFSDDPNRYRHIDEKFVAMGTLQGRTYGEIFAIVGKPMLSESDGEFTVCAWGRSGFMSYWNLILQFDKYGVCVMIGHETGR